MYLLTWANKGDDFSHESEFERKGAALVNYKRLLTLESCAAAAVYRLTVDGTVLTRTESHCAGYSFA